MDTLEYRVSFLWKIKYSLSNYFNILTCRDTVENSKKLSSLVLTIHILICPVNNKAF